MENKEETRKEGLSTSVVLRRAEDGAAEGEEVEFTDLVDIEKVETQGLVGEVESEPPAGETEDFAPCPPMTMIPVPVSAGLKKLIAERISCLTRLEQLEKARQQFAKDNVLEEGVKNALAGQTAELKALPPQAIVNEKQNSLVERIKNIRAHFREATDANAPTPEVIAQTEQCWRYALKQYEIFTERNRAGAALSELIANEYCPHEPLYLLCKHFGYHAERVFAMAVYHLAIEAWQSHLNDERKPLQQRLNTLQAQKSLNPFGHHKEEEEKQKIQVRIDEIGHYSQMLSRELASLQKDLLAEYWKLYEFAACLFVKRDLPEAQILVLRLTLRFGVLGHAAYFLSPQVLEFMRQSCLQDSPAGYDFSMTASHVMYADEYLQAIVNGDISASIDENLELTGRHSPEWHNDKALRRIAFSRARGYALREREISLRQFAETLREQQVKLEDKKNRLFRNDKDYKTKNAELAQKIQHCKVEAARYTRIIERINDYEIPQLKEREMEARAKLSASDVKNNRFAITRKEVTAIHRVCRLCARLKDTFPPFSLRDYFHPENKTVNDRAAVQAMLKEIEECDRFIFQDILVNSRKASQRITLRFHPVVLLAPNYGFLGYSWNPRAGMETGKLVFPLYCPRQGINTRIMYNMLADFQWDTSKATAGVDLLTSDTLVAAYAAVRWEYRKRKKENREKALIFNEINDRQNWRRHYELFLESAKDSGRKLFFKNPEVYEVVVKYLGLPPGCEKLRH